MRGSKVRGSWFDGNVETRSQTKQTIKHIVNCYDDMTAYATCKIEKSLYHEVPNNLEVSKHLMNKGNTDREFSTEKS